MSDYYKVQQMAYMKLNNMLKKGAELDINKIIVDFTLEFPISEKAIVKRIEKLEAVGVVKRYDNMMVVL